MFNNTVKTCIIKHKMTLCLGRCGILSPAIAKFLMGHFRNPVVLWVGLIERVRKKDNRFMFHRERFLNELEHHFSEPVQGKRVFKSIAFEGLSEKSVAKFMLVWERLKEFCTVTSNRWQGLKFLILSFCLFFMMAFILIHCEAQSTGIVPCGNLG